MSREGAFKHPTVDTAPTPVRLRALDAQSEVLPYALGFFGMTLPVFVWAGAYADNAVWMSAIFIQFSLNWAAFYAAVNVLRKHPVASERTRWALHIGGGLLWALAVAEIALFGANAGPAAGVILSIDVAAAVACMFFTSASFPTLAVVGPAAAASPLIVLFSRPEDHGAAIIASGALALAMALCLILNRILRHQLALAAEREVLMEERARSLAEAERATTSKSQIIATLSHEIRNGLTGVAHVLAAATGAGGRAAPSRDQLSAALTSANELLETLNATLDTETAGSGRLTVATHPFDPAALARAVVLLSKPHASAKDLELSLLVDAALEGPPSGAAMGDPARVRQVLANLIGNAVKYTARGQVEVRVQPSDGGRIRIEVADSGPGLSPAELERAFEPFARIERVGMGLPGAGLGLSLSRELARLMGGEIGAESALGVGSRFWLDLPYDPAAAAPAESDEPADPKHAVARPGARGLRVLVAEDDSLNAAVLRAVLEQLGHQVVHAHDGRRALELAEFCHFDLIMLDGRMPHLTGPEAAREIRTLAGDARDTPIIAVIGGDADEVEACLAAGVEEVLRKPVTVAAVARAVASAVRQGSGARGARTGRRARGGPGLR